MKRRWLLLLVPAILAAGAALLLLRPAASRLRRLSLAAVESTPDRELKPYRLDGRRGRGDRYVVSQSEGLTLKGAPLRLHGERRDIDLRPKLTGPYRWRMEALVLPDRGRGIGIEVWRDRVRPGGQRQGERLAARRLTGNEIITLGGEVRLAGEDVLRIRLEGNGAVGVGEPVLYRPVPPGQRRLVFVVCADTLRRDRLPLYGYSRDTAPRLQRFARDAVVFERAYTPVPWTLPAHASLFTSLFEFRHGVTRERRLPAAVDTLIEDLAPDFACRCLNGGGYLNARWGLFRGFDYYKSYARLGPTPQSAETLFARLREDLASHDFPAAFYFLHTYQTHSPYRPPPAALRRFNPNPPVTELASPRIPLPPASAERLRGQMTDLYDACVRAVDDGFGAFLDGLQRAGLYRQSLIVFLSDHGEEFYDHGGWSHGSQLYDEAVRIPLVVKFPGNRFAGRRSHDLVSLVDVLPTVLDAHGLSARRTAGPADGASLLAGLRGQPPARRFLPATVLQAVASPRGDVYRLGAIEKQHKVICSVPVPPPGDAPANWTGSSYEVYDTERDRGERVNRAAAEPWRADAYKGLFISIMKSWSLLLRGHGRAQAAGKELLRELQALGYL